jgi:HAMP domain-containing protein
MQQRATPATRRRPRLPRLALPTKLFVSYLVVVALGAVPTFLYVRQQLQGELVELAQAQLHTATARAANSLMPYDERRVLERVRVIAGVVPHRVTLIAPTGDLLFESEALTHANHAARPEVKAAFAGRPLVDVFDARRVSESTGDDTIYAATRLVPDGPVLRLASPIAPIVEAADALKRFARNVQAIAISAAIGFSLLAAVLFVRPLQRVVATARAFGNGDLSARAQVHRDDEVGDVSRALDQMAVDLRRRLANAGSGDAVVAQLVDAIPVPCVVVEASGDLLSLNGPARRALGIDSGSARRRIQELTQQGRFRRALDEAEADGDPEPCVLPLPDGSRFEGIVHVLKRPGAAPLIVLLGHDAPADGATTLPPVSSVSALPFDAVLAEARERARGALQAAGVAVEVDDSPGVLVADVGGRLGRAIALAFEGCARTVAGKGDIIGVVVHVEPTRVRLTFDAGVDDGLVDAVKPLVAPLGGDVAVGGKEVRLWLPRA